MLRWEPFRVMLRWEPFRVMLRLMKVKGYWLLPLVVLLAVCGCSHDTAAFARQTGTVEGEFLRFGGPAPGAPVPLVGRVVFAATGRSAVAVTIGANGKFSATLPVGNYNMHGTSPVIDGGSAPCSRPVSVTVRPHVRVHVHLVCDIK